MRFKLGAVMLSEHNCLFSSRDFIFPRIGETSSIQDDIDCLGSVRNYGLLLHHFHHMASFAQGSKGSYSMQMQSIPSYKDFFPQLKAEIFFFNKDI